MDSGCLSVPPQSGQKIEIRAAWSPGEVRIAVAADGALKDYALWRPGAPDGIGDVYQGRVTAIVPAMAGAFIALKAGPSGRSDMVDGFLPDSRGARGLTEGAVIPVRITRAAQGGKGPRLSALSASDEDGYPRRGADPLRELAARYAGAPILVDGLALEAALRAEFSERIVRVERAFEDAIDEEVEALTSMEVVLPSGVRLSVHPTPALVAIDVDGGGALAGNDTAARRHRDLNLAVLPEIARQIRLRNLSGAILVDLAGMKTRQRASLGSALAAALADDPLRPRFLGFTALGLAEISRPRVRIPLHEALRGPLASGLAAVRALVSRVRVEPGRSYMLHAAPAVLAALEADPVALPELRNILGQRLNTRSDPSLPADGWHIEA